MGQDHEGDAGREGPHGPAFDGSAAPGRVSPVRAQYDALKRAYPGCILLFQLGDFYESFEGDARLVAQVCGITLTSKEFARGDRVPLAGVPVARAERHIGRLVAAGHHVAICDQVSEPGHGLVERRVTRVITAGTIAEPGLVPPTENNLLVAVRRGRHGIGLAHVDVTTGELLATVLDGADVETALEAELQRLAPAECLVGADEAPLPGLGGHLTALDRVRFDEAVADEALRRLFDVGSLDGYGLAAGSPALGPLGALAGYIEEKNRPLLASLREPRMYSVGAHMVLDPSTRRNLELTRTAWSGRPRGSLLEAIDRTRTPMGARRLRRAVGQPLLDRVALERRLDAVEELVSRPDWRARVRLGLGRLGDMERLLGRVRQGSATPRDALTFARALRAVRELRDELSEPGDGAGPPHGVPFPEIARDACAAVADLIESALVEHGGSRVIRPGYSAELDELVNGIAGARRWIAELERRERERSGIRSLKVGYNKVFGYYIEVTRPNLGQVPGDYSRRQTLVNAERFVTPELKEYEARILTAEARIEELERELFQALLRRVGEFGAALVATIVAVAEVDLLQSLAERAAERDWARPSFADDGGIQIEGGRHPVLEGLLPSGEFVPNDCQLGPPAGVASAPVDGGRVLLVTGPNMAGKSTYLRQVALIVLLAQIGSFVPARAARLGLVDRVFTRVGSHDDLASGASTFLVEMAETANILRHATPRSLVVLDEVGRGTSTHDGLCIARAVLEHLHDVVRARTLFATHYHELTALADELSGLRNVTVAVDDADGRLAFLYRVVAGAADRSYGVQVARLAGLPGAVTDRAAALLRLLEARGLDRTSADASGEPPALAATPETPDRRNGRSAGEPDVLGPLHFREWQVAYEPAPCLPDGAAPRLLGELLALDLSSVTPLRALNLLHEMQAAARDSLPWREWLAETLSRESRIASHLSEPPTGDS